jgi:hypothetical protein
VLHMLEVKGALEMDGQSLIREALS